MVNPVGLKTVKLHGRFVEPNVLATPLQGTVVFTPAPSPIIFPNENVIVQGSETATLDTNGEFTIELICTDTAGQNPTGWTYTVNERILNQKPRSYQILLPYTDTTSAPIELADITPSDAAPTYLPVVGPQGPPGVIQTVNGKTGTSITLVPSDLGAIASTEKGAASGVATLDSGSKIPVAQLPDVSGTYVAVTQKGAVNGVATLDGTGKHTVAQYNFSASTPPSVATAGAVGTSTSPARADHTHSGLDLSTDQSAGGKKTWTSDAYFNGGKLGVNSGTSLTARAMVTSSLDEVSVRVVQGTVSATSEVVKLEAKSATTPLIGGWVNADTQNRIAVFADGQIKWGPGNAATDATLYRSGVGVLAVSGNLAISGTASASSPVASTDVATKGYVDGASTFSGVKTFSATPVFNAGATFNTTAVASNVAFGFTGAATSTVMLNSKVTSDTQNRLQITADGGLNWGPGNAATDTILTRIGSGNLGLTGRMTMTRAAATNPELSFLVTGDTQDRLQITADGKHSWGPGGSTATDTTLYRNSAGELKTDGKLTVGTTLLASGMTSAYSEEFSSVNVPGTSYAAGSPALSVSAVVPPSGKVRVYGHVRQDVNAGHFVFSAMNIVGSVTGAIISPLDARAVMCGSTGSYTQASASIVHRITSSNIGETITVTWQHKIDTSGALSTIYARSLGIEPLMN